jgi:hypothetical protein
VVAADDRQAGNIARRQERGLRECIVAIGIGRKSRGAGLTWSLVVLLVVVLANKRWNGLRQGWSPA